MKSARRRVFKETESFLYGQLGRSLILLMVAVVWGAIGLTALPSQTLAQLPQITVGTASGAAGTSVNLNVNFTTGATGVSTLQFDLTLPAGLSYVSVATGSAATAAGKSASASPISGGVRILVFGVNQNIIGSGTVATVTLSIAANVLPGTLSIGITGIVASDPNGNNIPTTGSGGSVVVPDTTPPSVPSGLTASAVSSTQINLSWSASTDNVGVTGYKIFRNGTQVGTSTLTTFQDTGLTASTTYSYTVSAFDAAGNNSAQSAAASATTQTPSDTIPPSIPVGLTASAVSTTQINLAWIASTDNVGVAGYKIFRNGSQVATSAVTSFQDTGLTASTTYRYTVAAFDAAGNNSAQSAAASATTQQTVADTTPPSVPTGLTATAASSSQINLTWNASSDNVGVAGYKIFRNGSQVATSAVTSFQDTGLTASTTYRYTVSAFDAAGNSSAQSAVMSATTQAQTSNRQACSQGDGHCFNAMLPASGGISKSSTGEGGISVLYGTVTSSAVSMPVAFADFGLTQNGVLVTEVGVAASAPVTSTRMFVDFGGTSGNKTALLNSGENTITNTGHLDSGIALVNPGDNPNTIHVELKNQRGEFVTSTDFTIAPKAHVAKFISELVPNLPNPFLGTITLSSASPFAAVNLRQATNGYGETIFSSLPLTDLNNPSAATKLIFPQIADGGGLPTQILLLNPSGFATGTGYVAFYDDTGAPMPLDFGPGIGVQTSLAYSMPPNGMVKFSTTGLGDVHVGYAVVNSISGLLPVGSVIFSSNGNAGLASQAGVLNAPETTLARMVVEKATPPSQPLNKNTGIAIVNQNGVDAQITLNLMWMDGSSDTQRINVAPNGHTAKFVSEIFQGLPMNFQGVLTLTSNVPVATMMLRLTTNQRGESIYSTLPVVDLSHSIVGPQYIPQIVDGGGYQTQLIMINTSNSLGMIQLDFFNNQGGSTALLLQ